MGIKDPIYTGRHCTIEGLPGLYRVTYWFQNPDKKYVVWVKGVDEQGKLLCSLDPSGTVSVERKDVHWITTQGDTLWT